MSLIPWPQLIGLKMNDYLFIGELIRLYLLGKKPKERVNQQKQKWVEKLYKLFIPPKK